MEKKTCANCQNWMVCHVYDEEGTEEIKCNKWFLSIGLYQEILEKEDYDKRRIYDDKYMNSLISKYYCD